MEYFNRISDLIHHKHDYESASYYIKELLSNKSLSKQDETLLKLKLRYCALKRGKIKSKSLVAINESEWHLSKALDINLVSLGENGHHLTELSISPKVTIILPIYNAPIALKGCLDSLLNCTPSSVRIIAINDASTDPEISNLLDSYSIAQNLDIYTNAENLGFSGTVNRGFSLANNNDVIILNSDTVVTPGWVSNLKIKAYSNPRIATVTPLSNSAGPFSVAKTCSSRQAIQIQKLLNSLGCEHHFESLQEMPTGHGFCLYIKSKAFEEVGYFDQLNFPRGYGEENDFCMRLKKKQYINTLDTKTYIYHAEAASFGSENKMSMVKEGRLKVDELHPEYTQEIRDYFASANYKQAIENLNSFLQENISTSAARNALFLVNVKTGGTPQTNRDLMIALKKNYNIQPFCLYVRKSAAQLSAIDDNFDEIFGSEYPIPETRLPSHANQFLERIYIQLLEKFRFSFVHVRHMGWHSVKIFDILKLFHVPCFFSLHDFYTVCPNIKLQDADNKHCGGDCLQSKAANDCKYELWDHPFSNVLKNDGVYKWQSIFKKCLSDANALITTSHTAFEIVQSVYPDVVSCKDFRIIEHGRELYLSSSKSRKPKKPSTESKLKLLAPGNITDTKGGLLIKQLAQDEQLSSCLEVHILGNIQNQLNINDNSSIICHGGYDRNDFPEIVAALSPDIGLVLSIWPETYCHTLTELWMCDVPVIGTNLGAVGDRLRKCGGGWVIDPTYGSLKFILNKLLKNRDLINDAQDSIINRSDYGLYPFILPVNVMAREYMSIYRTYCQDLA